MGSHILRTIMLAELNALIATRFSASAAFAVFRQYSFSIWAVVVVVINVSVSRRILLGIRVVRGYFCHNNPPVNLGLT